jgi:hypothetical protein
VTIVRKRRAESAAAIMSGAGPLRPCCLQSLMLKDKGFRGWSVWKG